MARFIYTAKSEPQKIIQAQIEAESEQEAINKLARMGVFPISIKPETLSLEKQGTLSLSKVQRRDVVLFTRQLTNLVESGVVIINSLSIIANQVSNKYLKAVINDISSKIRDGRSLSESLASQPRLFPSFYTSMVHSGEVSGNLGPTLKRLADFLEKEEEFKNSIRAALTYPLFILAVSILTVVTLLGFVIPRLVTMFEDMGQILPLPTKILINISGFLRNYWWFLLAVIFIAVFLLRRLYLAPQGRLLFDKLRLTFPVWGDIVLKTEVSHLMRTLSLLLVGGIPILTSLEIATSILDNQLIKLEIQNFRGRIVDGSSFSVCLKDSKIFPQFVTNIVAVGEETGTLEKSLQRIADDYEREVDGTLKTFTRMLEPVIILAMGIIVGFIVLSMLLPIFQINLIVR